LGRYKKTTPEERKRWQENQDRLLRIIERRLAEEEAARKAKEEQAAEPASG